MILEIGQPAHGGFCVSRVPESDASGLGGKVALVAGALPGELVRVAVVAERPRHLLADVVEVLKASPDRVAHVWPLAAATGVGGADLGHVAAAAQLRWKEAVIQDALRRIGGPAVFEQVAKLHPEGLVPVSAVGEGVIGWRTRVGLVAAEGGQFAMRRSRSHDLVVLDGMPLAVPEIAALRLFSGDSAGGVAGAGRTAGGAATAAGAAAAGSWRLPPGAEVRAVMPSASEPVLVTPTGVWRAPGVPGPSHVRETVSVDGQEYRYQLAAGSFWQAHRAAPEVLVRAVLAGAGLQPGGRVLELYSGAGLFTLPLAQAVGEKGAVLALEGSREAVADAETNLKAHFGSRAAGVVAVRRARVDARTLARLKSSASGLAGGLASGLDLAVLDPPRTGAGGAVVAELIQLAPGRIVYVACDPAALARDLKSLLGTYEIASIAAYDLFPSTHHVELVVTLNRDSRNPRHS